MFELIYFKNERLNALFQQTKIVFILLTNNFKM